MKKYRRRLAFDQIADTAAINHYRSRCWRKSTLSDKQILAKIHHVNLGWEHGYAMPTFKNPTDCKTGFYKVLEKIAIHTIGHSGLTTKHLCKILETKSISLTLRRLEWAKLVTLDRDGSHEWMVTGLGKEYLAALEKEFILD